MALIDGLRERVERLAALVALDVEPDLFAARMDGLADERVLHVVEETSGLIDDLERVRLIAVGVIARRSARERGQRGLSATRGHASPSSLIQSLTGVRKADADRQVRQGTSILDATDAAPPTSGDRSGAEEPGVGGTERDSASPPEARWDEAPRRALLEGSLSPARHDAIVRGLGEPPRPRETTGARAAGSDAEGGAADPESAAARASAVAEVWAIAAAQLIAEAAEYAPDDLVRRARQVRDALDPIGAEERFAHRFEKRSFRTWTDADGQRHGHIVFDDEMGAWVQGVVAAALRPRRGGPRFVAEGDRRAADDLVADPRSNDQLAYDLLLDVLRAGTLADAESVHGVRRPGVRMVAVRAPALEGGGIGNGGTEGSIEPRVAGSRGETIGPRDASGVLVAVAHDEDGGDAFPGSVLERALCDTGHREVTVDERGDPLAVGREQRLFTGTQRVALAIRDGGCRWRGCRVPASYCEAHHLDPWSRGGRTDLDRGILLCRFHHMSLHNNAWRIARDGPGEFVLHPPGGGDPLPLPSRSPIAWAWNPPPPPARPGWRHPPLATPERELVVAAPGADRDRVPRDRVHRDRAPRDRAHRDRSGGATP